MLIDNESYKFIFNSLYIFTAYITILSALSIEVRHDLLVQNKLANYLVILPLLGLIVITGFRAYDVGTDTGNYYEFLWLADQKFKFSGEFLFLLISKILHYYDLSYSSFLLFIAFLFFGFIYKASKHYSELYRANILMTVFSFMSFFFFSNMSINIIRQGLSLAILLYALTLLLQKDNKLKIAIYCLIALACHTTSVIPVLLILVSYYLSSKSEKLIYFLVLLYFLIAILAFFNIGLLNISPLLLQVLGNEGRSSYITSDAGDYVVGFKAQFFAFNTFFLCIALYIRKRITENSLKNQYNVILIYYIMASWLLFLAFQIPFSDRWGLFSWVIVPFLITPLFYSPYLKGRIRIHYVLMLILIYIGSKFYAG